MQQSRKRIEATVSKVTNLFDCSLMEGIVDIDMKKMFSHKLPETYVEKCFAACLGEVAGIVS